jgi:hypothetical protein
MPEDLSAMSDEELIEMRASIAARAEEIAGSEELTDADIEEITALADAGDAIASELQAREAAATARNDKVAEAMSRLKTEDAIEELEVEDTVDEQAEVVSEEEITEDITAEEQVPVAATADDDKTQALAAARPAAAAPKTTEEPREFMRASAHATGVREGHVFSNPFEVANAIARKRASMTVMPEGVRDFVPIATGMKEGIEFSVGNDAVENFGVLRNVQTQAAALVASGGCVPPITPLYDFYRLAVAQNPVEEGLQVVQAPRGGIRYIQSPDTASALTEANAGLDVSAVGRDYDAVSGDGPKAVATVSCPTVAEEQVEAVSQVIQFDNLQYRTFPEQVEAFLEDVAVAFASKKEVYYLDAIDAASTAATSTPSYGASRGLMSDWTLAAVAYRKRHGMRRDAIVNIIAPDWAIEMVKLDIALDHSMGHNFWDISDAQALAGLRARGIEPIWHNDSVTSAGQKFDTAQSAGALNAFPSTVVSYVMAPGTFVRLDGGTLDVGLVRDSTLNGTNDLQLFMEEWIGIAQLGFESVKLTSTTSVDGSGPAAV